MIVKYSKEVSDFIQACGAKSDNDYYWFPYYFKKVGDSLFERVLFNDLPDEVKHFVEQSENRNPIE